MLRTVASRAGAAALTLLVAGFVIFLALYLAPGDPVTLLSGGRALSPQAQAALREQYHLNDPFLVRWVLWLKGVVQGDFGTSTVYRQDVWSLLTPRIATTAWLLCFSTVLTLLAGIGLGTLAGLRGGGVRTGITVVTSTAMAIPTFVAAVVLTLVFAVTLGWFPVSGSGNGVVDRIHHLALPALALALAGMAFVARLTQEAVVTERAREHVTTAVVRGLPRRRIIRHHVMRNAAIPITTVAGITVASLIAGTAIVEQAFQLDGLGSLLVSSVAHRDFPLIQAICLLFVVAFVITNSIVDALYGTLDPRTRER